MISTLIELAKAIGQFSRDRRIDRRVQWDRIADHMEKIADALDGPLELTGTAAPLIENTCSYSAMP